MTEDPDVPLHTMVGKTAIYHSHGSKMISKHGLLYVKKGKLCHETALRNRLSHKCLKKAWPLSDIKQITVMNGETLTVAGSKSAKGLSLNPGVKMIFQDSEGNCQTLVVSLPHASVDNADSFSSQLRRCVDTHMDMAHNGNT